MLVVYNPNSLFKFRHRIDIDRRCAVGDDDDDDRCVSPETKRFSSPETDMMTTTVGSENAAGAVAWSVPTYLLALLLSIVESFALDLSFGHFVCL